MSSWVREVISRLQLSRRAVLVLIRDADLVHLRPLGLGLLDAFEDLHVALEPSDLDGVPAGSTVLLILRADQLPWLNRARPILGMLRVVLVVPGAEGGLAALREHAPDAADWSSHVIDASPEVPEALLAQLRAAEHAEPGLVWRGASPLPCFAALGVDVVEISAKQKHAVIASVLAETSAPAVVWREVTGDFRRRRVEWVMASETPPRWSVMVHNQAVAGWTTIEGELIDPWQLRRKVGDVAPADAAKLAVLAGGSELALATAEGSVRSLRRPLEFRPPAPWTDGPMGDDRAGLRARGSDAVLAAAGSSLFGAHFDTTEYLLQFVGEDVLGALDLRAELESNYAHYDAARGAYEASIRLKEGAYGTKEHPSIAVSLHGLANVLEFQGKYEKAERTYRESIRLTEGAYGAKEHPSIAASLSGLASALESQGKYEEAERTYRNSIRMKEAAYGTKEHPSIAVSLNGLANVLVDLGRYEEAERMYGESLRLKNESYRTTHHPEIAVSLNGLANALVHQGKYEEAARMYREALSLKEAAYGTKEHPSIALSMGGLASVLVHQGLYEEAERTYRETVSVLQRTYGTKEFPEVALSMCGLANVLGLQGKYEEAERTYRESIRLQEGAYGTKEHPEIAVSLHGLALVLAHQGKYEDAERMYRASIRLREGVYGTREHPNLLPTLNGLARVLLAQDRPLDAERPARDSWEIAQRLGLVADAVRCGAMYIAVLAALGRDEEARLVRETLRTKLVELPAQDPVRLGVERQLQASLHPSG